MFFFFFRVRVFHPSTIPVVEEGLEEMWSSAVSPKLQQEHRVPLPTAATRSDLISAQEQLSSAFISGKVLGI